MAKVTITGAISVSSLECPIEVTLVMSIEEASVLRTLLYRHVAGRMQGNRKYLDSIESALCEAGVSVTDLEAPKSTELKMSGLSINWSEVILN
jgi:hypothetical protein